MNFFGTAAWTLPKEHRAEFVAGESHLASYASRLNAVEINTSFYRDHKRATYERWAATVGEDFRFSVKLSKIFTHEQKLADGAKSLRDNISDIRGLGRKWGCLLVQLPPKLAFDDDVAERFFSGLRDLYDGPVAFEPRHISWQSRAARRLLHELKISRVIADPQPYLKGSLGTEDLDGVAYFRLHGSPQIYKSSYENERLRDYAEQVARLAHSGRPTWCIFDNTTFGHATGNALELKRLVEQLGNSVGQELAGGRRDVQAVRNQLG